MHFTNIFVWDYGNLNPEFQKNLSSPLGENPIFKLKKSKFYITYRQSTKPV